MKLIIDIPEEQYNDIVKHLTDNDGNYAYSDFKLREIIRNGTPYNPTGDLISREALKAELEAYRHTRNYKSDEDEAQNNLLDNILEDIDNAQAVEYTFEEAFQKTVCENRLYCPARPKGECVDISKLRLMTVEECAGHTIDYAMGWKACIEWIKKGGTE